jgi:hypothetical protein
MIKKISTIVFSVALLLSLSSPLAAQPESIDYSFICHGYMKPISAEDIDPENIKAEFFVATSNGFRKSMVKNLKKTSINEVFPNVYWYGRSFETETVAYLYERVIHQIDLDALSFLIKLMRNENHQTSTDAMSAIAFIHFQISAPDDVKRGIELINSALKGNDSYPASIFWGRALAMGGPYTGKEINTAIIYLEAAGSIPAKRDYERKEFDKLNDMGVHTQTIMYLLENIPNIPLRQDYENHIVVATEVMKLQQDYKTNFINSAYYVNAEKKLAAEFLSIFESTRIKNLHLLEPNKRTSVLTIDILLSRQDSLVQKIALLNKDDQNYQALILQLFNHNTALHQTLNDQQYMLLNAFFGSFKEPFPKNVVPIMMLRQTQLALARSCSLKQSWNKLLK